MFVVGDFLLAAARIVDVLLNLYMYVIIIVAILSWVNPDPYNPIVRFLHAVTEPVLRPVRRFIGYRLGAIDISPLIVILGIMFIRSFLVRTLIKIGFRLGGG